ncbi:MAG: hypothetical protein FWF73_07975 [Spirochaetes bacterium]|nr:hypothetical protein [Spirochaetota bacterium]
MNKCHKTNSGDEKSPVFLAMALEKFSSKSIDIKDIKMKDKKKPFIYLMIIIFFSCSSTDKISFYRAVEKADTEIINGKVGLIRTIYCDIYIEHIDTNTWKYINKYNTFKGGGIESPSDPCFHFIIENTWNKPIVIDKIEIINKDNIAQSEDYSFIQDKNYLEDRYTINISSLLKSRRILSEHILVKDIDFEDETTLYKLYFIAPGDKVSFFRLFSNIPSGKLSKIRVSIKYSDLKKVIDFDIDRFDNNDIEEVNRYMEFL